MTQMTPGFSQLNRNELWTHDDSDGVVSGIKRPELQINTYQYRDHTQMATPTLFAQKKKILLGQTKPSCILSTAFFWGVLQRLCVCVCSSCQSSFELPQRIVVEVGNSMPGSPVVMGGIGALRWLGRNSADTAAKAP